MTDEPTLDIDIQTLMPFARTCGMRVVRATRSEVRGEMDWTPELCTSFGVLHGGALIAFADTMGATCAVLNLPPGTTTTTIELKTNFFRPVRAGRAHAVSTPLHVGRTTIVCQTDVRDDAGKRIALITQTQAVIPLKD
jgi:1,4-dihydroxy-2-naphthoyl-CoA hydrolase